MNTLNAESILSWYMISSYLIDYSFCFNGGRWWRRHATDPSRCRQTVWTRLMPHDGRWITEVAKWNSKCHGKNRRWQQHVRERKKVFTIEDSVEWDEHIIVPLFVPLLLVFLTDSCESLALAAVRCTFNNGNLGQWLHRSLHRGGIRIRFT